jgi:hypothetical protein
MFLRLCLVEFLLDFFDEFLLEGFLVEFFGLDFFVLFLGLLILLVLFFGAPGVKYLSQT